MIQHLQTAGLAVAAYSLTDSQCELWPIPGLCKGNKSKSATGGRRQQSCTFPCFMLGGSLMNGQTGSSASHIRHVFMQAVANKHGNNQLIYYCCFNLRKMSILFVARLQERSRAVPGGYRMGWRVTSSQETWEMKQRKSLTAEFPVVNFYAITLLFWHLFL